MNDTMHDPRATAEGYVGTAREAFRQSASLFRSLSGDDWEAPTGCAHWTMHHLAGHIVGEAVYFAHLVPQSAENEPALPDDLWGQLSALPGEGIAERIERAADELVRNVERVSDEGLGQPADLGFITLPLYRALFMSLFEGVIHDWDTRARRGPDAHLHTDWAVQIAGGLAPMAGGLAHRDALSGAAGTYVLEVADGVGRVTIRITTDGASIESGGNGNPDVTLALNADGYVRLITGRYPLAAAIDRGEVKVDGDRARAEGLNRVFAGVANG
jgi:uncharacterized protein (TIGR03083 family)